MYRIRSLSSQIMKNIPSHPARHHRKLRIVTNSPPDITHRRRSRRLARVAAVSGCGLRFSFPAAGRWLGEERGATGQTSRDARETSEDTRPNRPRTPGQTGRGHRAKPAGGTGVNRPATPGVSRRRRRLKPDGDSRSNRAAALGGPAGHGMEQAACRIGLRGDRSLCHSAVDRVWLRVYRPG
jgi:hypothetical protein